MDTRRIVNASQPNGPTLPVELVIAVLNCLTDDKLTLLACSRVNFSWRQIIAPHIFHAIQVDNAKPGRGLSRFVTLIDSLSGVCQHVHSLHIQGASLGGFQPICPSFLMQILGALESLQDLELDGCDWVGFPSGLRQTSTTSSPLSSLKPLNSLTLRYLRHNGRKCRPKDIFSLLSMFTYIRTLKLEQISYSDPSQNSPRNVTALPFKLALERLEIGNISWRSNISVQHFFTFLKERIALEGLRKLDIRCQNRTHLLIAGAFLRDVKLTELSLNVSPMEAYVRIGNQPVWELLNLDTQTALKSLSIRVWTSGVHEFEDANDPSQVFIGQWCICSALDILTFTPSTVEHVTILLSLSSNGLQIPWHLICQFSWSGLQNQLKRMTRLKSFTFEITVPNGVEMAHEICLLTAKVLGQRLSEFGYKVECLYLESPVRSIEGLKVGVLF